MNWPSTRGLLTETVFKTLVLSVFLFCVIFFPAQAGIPTDPPTTMLYSF